ncbi:MAG: putative acetyltransferase [Herbinix sp.]|jgi:N-acetylglutamate synthase-like GNAT family acetyltransferase|nr:putative acetyltransferase [Herbinix sp.]
MEERIISIRENPDFLTRGIDYFATKWGIERRIYEDCITNSLTTESKLPRWYLMLKNDEIIGCFGLIVNDFVSRQDLYPYLCALYIEESERGRELGSVLLDHGRNEANILGYSKVYLCTDHRSYYEKYGWKHIATGYHPWGTESRIYEIDSVNS